MFHFNEQTWKDYRPIYLICWQIFYTVFGFSTDYYHLLNTFLFFSDAVLIYLILKKIDTQRIFYLSVPLIFVFLPNYSTIHFWPSVIPNHFCLSLLLLSLLFDLKALETGFPRILLWKFISVVTIIASVLTYELFLPFFYLNLIVTVYYYKLLKNKNPELAGKGKQINAKKLFYLLLTNFLSLKIVLVYKLYFTVTTVRLLGNETSLTEHFGWLILNIFRWDYSEYEYGFNVKQSLVTNFIEYGIQLPDKLLQVYSYYPDKMILLVGLLIAFLIFILIYNVVKKYEIKFFSLRTAGKYFLAGIVLFFWGYSIFFTNYSIVFTPTGIGNRVSIGASIGIAVIWIGLIIGLSSIIRHQKFRNIFFSLSVAALCFSGFIIINTISSFWIKAYETEKNILEEIKNQIPVLQEGTRFMLDGVCPYSGPAIIFESNWDLAGALRIIYSKKDLKADIITPNLGINEEGFITSLYEEELFYKYDILIYNYNEKKFYIISNLDDAIHYFESVNTNYNDICPEGHEAHGVKIFW